MRLATSGRTQFKAAAILWALVIGASMAAAVHADDAARLTTVASSAEDAVRSAVNAEGDVYAGDCTATISPRDSGKVCSRLIIEKDGARAYLAGRTFSEFSRWIFVTPVGDAWRVAGVAQLDFFGPPEPPWP